MVDWSPGGKTISEAFGMCYMIRCLSCRRLTKVSVEKFLDHGFTHSSKVSDIQPRLRCTCGSKTTAVLLMPWWSARHTSWNKWPEEGN